jgi:hypothetical protein
MAPLKLDIGNILGNFVGHFWGKGTEWQTDPHPIKYVVAKNGLFELRDTEIFMVSAKPVEVKGMEVALAEGIIMKTPKIPLQMYYTALKFLRAIYGRDGTEATIHWFWDREKEEYFLWVPKQVNAGAASDYERDKDEEFTAMCNQYVWVMTAHSHPTFAGSFSSIDDADEKDTRLFMVVGKIMDEKQDIAIRTMVNGKPVNLKFYDVFTNPYDMAGEIPKEWLDRCSKKVYTAAKTNYGTTTYVSGAAQSRFNDYDGPYYGRGYYEGRGYGYGYGYEDYDPDSYDDLDTRFARNQYGQTPIGMDEVPPEDIVSDNPAVVNALALQELDREKPKSVTQLLKERNFRQLPGKGNSGKHKEKTSSK